MDDLAEPKREHLPGAALDRGAGLLPTAPLMEADDDGVAGIDRLFGLEAEIVEGSGPLPEELAHLRRAVVGDRLRKRADVVPFDVLVEGREQGFRIRRTRIRQGAPQYVEVALGHRSREYLAGASLDKKRRPGKGWKPRDGANSLSRAKRMMGLEPTTFCMASRRSSQLSY